MYVFMHVLLSHTNSLELFTNCNDLHIICVTKPNQINDDVIIKYYIGLLSLNHIIVLIRLICEKLQTVTLFPCLSRRYPGVELTERFLSRIYSWSMKSLDYIDSFYCSAVDGILERNPRVVNISKADGFTALHLAAVNDHGDIVKSIVRQVIIHAQPCRHKTGNQC